MAEATTSQTEVEARRPRLDKAKAFIAASILAGLALTACTEGTNATPSPSYSQSSAPRTTETTPAPATTTLEETPTPTKTITATPTRSHLPTEAEGLAGCVPYLDVASYRNHEYEVCIAYIENAATVALGGLYKFGNNRISYVSDAAKHHFETRYWDQPRRTAEQEIDSWPTTSAVAGNEVETSITLTSLSANLKADRALIQTQESWKVTARDGTTLLNEPLHTKDATMCRGELPGHLLHEWVVVRGTRISNFDCIGFDEEHGLKP